MSHLQAEYETALMDHFEFVRKMEFSFTPDDGEPIHIDRISAWGIVSNKDASAICVERTEMSDLKIPENVYGSIHAMSRYDEFHRRFFSSNSICLLCTVIIGAFDIFPKRLYVFGSDSIDARKNAAELADRWLKNAMGGGQLFKPLKVKPAKNNYAESEFDCYMEDSEGNTTPCL